MGDTEALFLVDNDQPEPFEFDRFGKHRMGTDDDVHRAVREPIARGSSFCSRHKTRQPAEPQRQIAEPFGKIAVMLTCQQSRWRNNRHLISSHGSSECGTHRNLGLAEADVTANQPVHRFARCHVVEYLDDNPLLIVGFLIGEAVDEAGIGLIFDFDHRPGP